MTAPDCGDPVGCMVPDPDAVDLRGLRLTHLAAGTSFPTVHRTKYPAGQFNASGLGNSRFSPLHDEDGGVIATLYGARTRVAALLETAFHTVHAGYPRIVYEAWLTERGLVTLRTPQRIALVDLRDDQLERLGLQRDQLVATTPMHYPCTRAWARKLRSRRIGGVTPAGLLWRSRVAELAGGDSLLLEDLLAGEPADVWMLFGDRLPTEPSDWTPGPPNYEDLVGGEGRLLIEQIATQLDATIHPNA